MAKVGVTPSVENTMDKAGSGPEPRWYIFRLVNFVAVGVLGWILADYGVNATEHWHENDSTSLFKFLVAWSLLMCYFFGFFGVTFVHDLTDEAQVNSPQPVVKSSSRNIQRSDVVKPVKKLPESKMPADHCVASPAKPSKSKRSPDEPVDQLSDESIAELVLTNQMKDHELEKRLDAHRAVQVRRLVVGSKLASLGRPTTALQGLPHQHAVDYNRVHGANCEIVVGYVPIPVGIIGPMTINDEPVYIPMATTEGCLVASANRGAKAITQGGGAYAEVVRDGISRAPCVRMPSAREAAALKRWCEEPENFAELKAAFESTTAYGKLRSCSPTVAGKNVYLRLVCFSGDAMGMNMVSKGSLAVIDLLRQAFPSMELVALSGNMCTDKKAAAINWIEGRGKSVVVECNIPKEVVKKTLKTTVEAMVYTNTHKNLIGSAMAGAVGGFNAHASNIVTAVFLASGQDPAQNVESSNCITLIEETENGDLWMSCTMPSLEVGTVGGGTSLAAQAACLKVMGVKGEPTYPDGSKKNPGEDSCQLARIVASATMAGELSLLAALAANTLVAAHMKHNRKPATSN